MNCSGVEKAHFLVHCLANFIRMLLLLIAENSMFEISVINGVDLYSFQKILNTSVFCQKFSESPPQGKVKNEIY